MKRYFVTIFFVLFALAACTQYSIHKDPEFIHIKQQLNATAKKIDVLASRLTSILSRLDNQEKKLGTLQASLDSRILGTASDATVGSKRVSEPSFFIQKSVSPQMIYQQALSDYHNKDYPAALNRFSTLKDTFPYHPLAQKAKSWIHYIERISARPHTQKKEGEVRKIYERAVGAYNRNNYQKARQLFSQLIENYPDHLLAKRANAWIRFIDSNIKRPSESHAITLSQPPATIHQPTISPNQPKVDHDAVRLYRMAIKAYKSHEFDKSLQLFQTIEKKYPDHILADNAGYWVGECLYAKRDFYGALLAFKQVVEKYPNGNKVPDAILKTGYAYLALQDPENARIFFNQVIASYPESPAAKRAKKKIHELNQVKISSPPPSTSDPSVPPTPPVVPSSPKNPADEQKMQVRLVTP